MRAWKAFILVGTLAGCTGAPPVVLKGDELFVTVSQPEHTRKSAVTEVARAYCQSFGKRATLLSDACPEAKCAERSITYWCQ